MNDIQNKRGKKISIEGDKKMIYCSKCQSKNIIVKWMNPPDKENISIDSMDIKSLIELLKEIVYEIRCSSCGYVKTYSSKETK